MRNGALTLFLSLATSKLSLATECLDNNPSEVCQLKVLGVDTCDRLVRMTCDNDLGIGSGTKFVQPGQWFVLPGPDGRLVGRCQCPRHYKRVNVLPGSPVGGWGGWGGRGPSELE